jgi:hypothetical protein
MLELAQTQEELVQLGAPTLSQVLDFPQLYRQYPEFAKIPVVRGDEKKSMLKKGERALTSSLDLEGREQYILINDHSSAGSQENEDKKSTDILIQIVSTLMHEAAHDIQDKEGMAPGGTPMRKSRDN